MSERLPQMGDGESVKSFSDLGSFRDRLAEQQVQQGDDGESAAEQPPRSLGDNVDEVQTIPVFTSRRVPIRAVASDEAASIPTVPTAAILPQEISVSGAEQPVIKKPLKVAEFVDGFVSALDAQNNGGEMVSGIKGADYPKSGRDIATEVAAYSPEKTASLIEQVTAGDTTFIDNGIERKPLPFLKEEIKRIIHELQIPEAVFVNDIEPKIKELSDAYRDKGKDAFRRREVAQRGMMDTLRRVVSRGYPPQGRTTESGANVIAAESSEVAATNPDTWIAINDAVGAYLVSLQQRKFGVGAQEGDSTYQEIQALQSALLSDLAEMNSLHGRWSTLSRDEVEKFNTLLDQVRVRYDSLQQQVTSLEGSVPGIAAAETIAIKDESSEVAVEQVTSPEAIVPPVAGEAASSTVVESVPFAVDAAQLVTDLVAAGVPESEAAVRVERLLAGRGGDANIPPLIESDVARFKYNVLHDPTAPWNQSAKSGGEVATVPARRDKGRVSGSRVPRNVPFSPDMFNRHHTGTTDDDVIERDVRRRQAEKSAADLREAHPVRTQEELFNDIRSLGDQLVVGDVRIEQLESLKKMVAAVREQDPIARAFILGKYQSKFESLIADESKSQSKDSATVVSERAGSAVGTAETAPSVAVPEAPLSVVGDTERVAALGTQLQSYLQNPLITEEEKVTAKAMFENFARLYEQGKDASVLTQGYENIERFISEKPSVEDISARVERGQAYVEQAAFDGETKRTAVAMLENYQRIAAGDASQSDYVAKVQQAYENYERFVREAEPGKYETSRQDWKESFRVHKEKKREYFDALKKHHESISWLAKAGKMIGMSPAAFAPTPELQAAEEAYKDARRAYAGNLSTVIKERRQKLHNPDMPFEQSAAIPTLNSAMARKFWVKPQRERVDMLRTKVLSPEKAEKLNRIGQFLHKNRWNARVAQVVIYGGIGAASGGASLFLVQAGSTAARMAAAIAAGYGAGKLVEKGFESGIVKSESEVKDALRDFSVESIDVEENDYIAAEIGLEKKKRVQKIAKVAASVLGGFTAGASVGALTEAPVSPSADTSTGEVADGAVPSPESPTPAPQAERFEGEVPGVKLNDPVLPFGPSTLPTDPMSSLSPLETPVYSPQAEQLPMDPNIDLPEPEQTTTFPTTPIEAIPPLPLVHDIRPGENLWQITSFYGADMLEGLTDRDRNAALMGLRSAINANPELQMAAGISSGDADMILEGDDLQMQPILDALRIEIDKVAPGHLPPLEVETEVPATVPEQPTALPKAPLSNELPNSPVDSDSSPMLVSQESVPSLGPNMLITESVVEQVKLQFPSLDAYNEARAGWIEKVQGPDPRVSAWERDWFFTKEPVHENAFNFMSVMKLSEIDALQARPVPERDAYLADHDIRVGDFNAWCAKLAQWRLHPSVSGVQPNVTFAAVADKAFALEYINKTTGTLV